MKFLKTAVDGLIIIQPTFFTDKRGYFMESFNKVKFDEFFKDISFIQDNESLSSKGVVRGLHFQRPPYSQAKLVRCVVGSVLDVVLDLRKNSATYGRTFSVELNEINKTQLFVPRGFAHGFAVLSDTALFSYKVDNTYVPEFEDGILWNDPDLSIDWKLPISEVSISSKDSELQFFSNFKNCF